jgi:hypothetical protein
LVLLDEDEVDDEVDEEDLKDLSDEDELDVSNDSAENGCGLAELELSPLLVGLFAF